jgi:hopanoid biosynthesis associated RND transporter like protein HpnN
MAGAWLTTPLLRWVGGVARRPWTVLVCIALATAALGWVALDRFRMNSNLSDLIRQEAPWRVDFDRFKEQFPDLVETAVVVVSGTSYRDVEAMTVRLESALLGRDDVFRAVYAPENDPFFRRHALLYLDEDDLDDMADRLAEAQPMLTAVAEDPSLRGVLELVGDGIENEPAAGFDTVVRLLAESGEAVLAGGDPTVSWTDEFFETDGTIHRLIFLKGQADFQESLANARVMKELRALIAGVPAIDGVDVRITGEVALAHEEIEAAYAGVQIAGWVALALLMIILIVGVRSAKIIIATVLLLFVGVTWTSAFAMLTVGEYNTLSIVFLVMFFGLGVDFALHFSLRYQEEINSGEGDALRSLASATNSVGGAITICTMTTALGFLSFYPTPYKGLADLGVISAGGMLVAGFLTFTLLPALYAVLGDIRPHIVDLPTGDRLVAYLSRHRGPVIAALVVGAALALFLATRAHFDYSVLALKDPRAESVVTLRVLQADDAVTDYALTIMSAQQAPEAALEELPTVETVLSPADYVPDGQDDKLFVLDDLQELLWSALEPLRTADPPTGTELREAVEALAATVAAAQAAAPSSPGVDRLAAVLTGLLERPPQALLIWQRGVITNLLEELGWLREALYVDALAFEDLPEKLRARLVSEEGQRVTVVTPSEDVTAVEALSEFVSSVREVAPTATGRPVIEWGVGGIVVGSFKQALGFATFAILAVLFLMFRNLRDSVLILVPLALAALFTLAASVVMDMPLNMANILVVPLIFGLGVDNGIHVVDRFHRAGDVGHLMHSSTPRAVMLSTLTTIGTFAALMLSPHQGTASIGLLLTLAVGLLLLLTIFVLPVLLALLVEPAET